MSLNHEFVIVDDIIKSNWNNLTSDFYANKANYDFVSIHDDFLRYFGDYFSFFKLYNPCKDETISNICFCGVTKIPHEVLGDAIKILENFYGIFSLAPDEIKLTGDFVFEHLDMPNSAGYYEKGHYETLTISKEKMCGKIHDLINLFSKAKNEKKCIMHCGV